MKYDVKIMFYAQNVEDIDVKMLFIPRIGDVLYSEILKQKCGNKACEVESVRLIYNDDLSEIDYIEIGIRPTI